MNYFELHQKWFEAINSQHGKQMKRFSIPKNKAQGMWYT